MSNNSRASKKRAVANTDRIVKMYKSGSNIVQISGEMGLFRRNVKAILISEGVLKKRSRLPKGNTGGTFCAFSVYNKNKMRRLWEELVRKEQWLTLAELLTCTRLVVI